ncbi:MAG: hypothetical protein M3174_00370 [Actinomycetota bacterium]|nr:hypothetical protein [Actinomycetota bacterium]
MSFVNMHWATKLRSQATLALALALVAVLANSAVGRTGVIDRVSLKPGGRQANRPSGFGVVSNDGRFVAYLSDAGRLVPGDTNGFTDVFVVNRRTGSTERVNVSSTGEQMPGPWGEENTYVDISGDGRIIAFATSSPGLVPNDTENYNDVFVHNRKTGRTMRVSVNSRGEQGNSHSFEPTLSANGRYVGFQSVASNLSHVRLPDDSKSTVRSYVHDRKTKTTSLVGLSSDGEVANDHTAALDLSSDGRFAVFDSSASNLVPDDRDPGSDVFVRDLFLGTTSYVSKSSREHPGNDGSFEPSISGNGRYVAFSSAASNLVRGDDNGADDVFVRDRARGSTVRVSVGTDGQEADGLSFGPAIAARATVVTFVSRATNLARGYSPADDVYAHNFKTGRTRLVSTSLRGEEANDHSLRPRPSADGRLVAFTSRASDLTVRDTNGVGDQFVWRRR